MVAPAILALLMAGQALTSTPARPVPPTVFFTAAQTYGECLKQGSAAPPASAKPEVAAQAVLAGCAAQRAALDAQFEAWIAGSGMPGPARDEARAQYSARMDGVSGQAAGTIRAARGAAAPAPGN